MRALIDSTEDIVPADIQKLNESIREQYGRIVTTAGPHSVGRLRLLDETPHGGEQRLLNIVDEVPRRGERRYLNIAAGPLASEGLEPRNGMIESSYPLERWLIQAHAYSEEQAAKVSLLGRLFSGEAQRVKAGVVHDAKRFSIVKTETSRDVEIGVAVRLSVATSNMSSNFELTLPNLAADAQLNGVEARVGITVLGFAGPLGDILPAPRKLDVETCAEYVEAFRKIQAFIFGDAGWRYVIPTALSYEA